MTESEESVDMASRTFWLIFGADGAGRGLDGGGRFLGKVSRNSR